MVWMKIVVFPDIILDLLEGNKSVQDVFLFHKKMRMELFACDTLEETVMNLKKSSSADEWNLKFKKNESILKDITLVENEKYLSKEFIAEECTSREDLLPSLSLYFFLHADAIWTKEFEDIGTYWIRYIVVEQGTANEFRVNYEDLNPELVYFRGTWVPVANKPPAPRCDVDKETGEVLVYTTLTDIPNMRFSREDAEEYLGKVGVYSYRNNRSFHPVGGGEDEDPDLDEKDKNLDNDEEDEDPDLDEEDKNLDNDEEDEI